MIITRFTQKQIREMVSNCYALDITNAQSRDAIPERYTQVGVSIGAYGSNGKVFLGLESGLLYAIIGRVSALFLF